MQNYSFTLESLKDFDLKMVMLPVGQLLSVPGLSGEMDSTRSSLSEVSVLSNASSRTYLDEASTLVLESTENGIKK